MKNLEIQLKKETDESYEIEFVEETSGRLSDFLLRKQYHKVLVVSDSNVYPLHFYNLLSGLSRDIQLESLELEAWEEYKNMEAVLKICSKLIEKKFNRNDCIIALGWGVIWDMVWFAGSIFKRGMNVIQIPTTLLSMFDSSVWWKTGVDFEDIKNIIGNFKQPKKVFINANYLETLPKKEVLSGYFEWIKHALLDSREYYSDFKLEGEVLFYTEKETKNLNKIIERNVSVKARIVMEDEKEMWIRKFLNYGHTFGHALEGVTNFSLSHGVCVWFGILYVNILSEKLGFLSQDDLKDINSFILEKLQKESENFSTVKKTDFEELYTKMTSDKKNIDANISFTLLDEPWRLHIEKVWVEKKWLLKECFDEFMKYIK